MLAVEKFFKDVDKSHFDVVKISHFNRSNNAPYLIIAQKIA